MIKPVTFPEVTSTQINVALVADKLNEVIAELNKAQQPSEPQLKPGVTVIENGRGSKRYLFAGRLIKQTEAFL